MTAFSLEHIVNGGLANISGMVWYNGKLVPWQDSSMHTHGHGAMYGRMVWEGIRMHNGVLFKGKEHMQRMLDAGKKITRDNPDVVEDFFYTADELVKAAENVAALNNLPDCYFRPTLFFGLNKLWLPEGDAVIGRNKSEATEGVLQPNIVIACWNLPYDKGAMENGIELIVDKEYIYPKSNAHSGVKIAGNYALTTEAFGRARRAGGYDAALVGEDGIIRGTPVSNIFFVKNGVLIAASTSTVMDGKQMPITLDGITRQTISQLGRNRKPTPINTRYQEISEDDLGEYEEAFAVGTALGVVPIRKFVKRDGTSHELPIGPITRWAQEQYRVATNG